MPITAAAAAISALSMAGFPPFLGFIGKELKYAGALGLESEPFAVAAAVLLANALMFAVAGIVAFKPFWRPGKKTPLAPHEGPLRMLVGPVLLALGGAVFGIAPGLLASTLVNPGVAAILGPDAQPGALKLWAGVNMPLILSIATFILGVALYMVHGRLRAVLGLAEKRLPNFDRGWDRLIDGVKAMAAWQTRRVQTGVMRHYVFVTFLTFVIGVAGTGLFTGAFDVSLNIVDVSLTKAVVVVLIIAGCLLTLSTSSRIAAIAGLGAVGIGVALIFIIYGAPDVAITQLLVETLVVVLFAVAALKLPRLDVGGRSKFRPFDAVLAVAVGATATAVLLAVTVGPIDRTITEYFERTAWPEAYGRNIVNVILVDFRALDTFGEIAVVAIAALSAFALLKGRKEGEGK
jgi:multicomponent Na+:H+ antiporter subunit A